jgi:outer membrane protein assembly factor BamB
MTHSSPNLIDLDGDGVQDIVFGIGIDRLQPQDGRMAWAAEPDPPGYVVAVSGATNDILWRAAQPGEAFTTPRFVELNRDGVPDVLMGGREGAFSAFSGVDGALLWRTEPRSVAQTPVPYNFFTPAVIGDVNDDGIADIVVVYGGNDLRLPGESRDPGYIALISGADGAVLAAYPTPDGRESYSAIVVYQRADGATWFIFGTGGETYGGAAYRAPVASLGDGSFPQRVERLIAPGQKGTMAPATLVELTGDGELDIVISTFDGRLIVVNGASGDVLWQRQDAGEESYHPAAVMRVSREGRLGLLVSRGIGVFPAYTGSVHRVHDARDGRVLYQYGDPFAPAGAPLAVDLTGDGIDEPFFFSMRFPRAQGGRIHILHGRSAELIAHEVSMNFASTPHIADPRDSGTLELIGLAWTVELGPDAPEWRDFRSQLLRLDLSAATPAFRSWAAYMGTATDGHYRPPRTERR